jgi:hypothetical protein
VQLLKRLKIAELKQMSRRPETVEVSSWGFTLLRRPDTSVLSVSKVVVFRRNSCRFG